MPVSLNATGLHSSRWRVACSWEWFISAIVIWCDAASVFELNVPKAVAATGLSAVSGDINASGMHGRVEANVVSGNVDVMNVGTSLYVQGVSGNITVANVGGDAHVENVSGRISVTNVGGSRAAGFCSQSHLKPLFHEWQSGHFYKKD